MSALTLVGSPSAARVSAGPVLRVDLAAVATNTRRLAAATTGGLMAVVKADGFGHGAVDVARTALAHGATWLGVTSLAEAWPLRDAGLTAPLLSWLNPVDADWTTALRREVDVAVPSRAHLEAVVLAARLSGRTARVHLHLDCGLARDGAAPAAWPALCRAARRAEGAGHVRVVGLMGHLPCADTDAVSARTANAPGRARFAWGIARAREAGLRPPHRHLAATSATLTDRLTHHTMSRIGAGLVGIDPGGSLAGARLEGALELRAPVVQVRAVRAGTGVGYGHTHRTGRATHLALLPAGYADGLPRTASGQAEVLLRGRRRPVVGRISMDQLVVDVGDGADGGVPEPGEQALLLGAGRRGEPTVAQWAAWSGLLPHEVVTGLGARWQREVAR
ncbi:alanine racemase [Nocardioides nanhaiensis]|uniref:Alanine racemase n=1 Tax=Nocardioides nanhaiensis TaxID=1476871 RepID=A0ABP8W0L5_9ACTN